jgi:phosphoribosylanthranilate isomerase
MYHIKICGITTAEDALLAIDAGADAIGLNCYAQSPRFVEPERAAEIVRAVREEHPPKSCEIYAVFVNSSADDILWTFRDAEFYGVEQSVHIQLHGDEPPELLAELKRHGLGRSADLLHATGHAPLVQIVRAFRCQNGLEQATEYLQRCRELVALPHAVLIDAFQSGSFGGTGQVVDWNAVGQRGDKLLGLPVVLAGGLTPDNVATAIETAQPQAVDVASGVESTPGRKDATKVRAFVAAARQALAVP